MPSTILFSQAPRASHGVDTLMAVGREDLDRTLGDLTTPEGTFFKAATYGAAAALGAAFLGISKRNVPWIGALVTGLLLVR